MNTYLHAAPAYVRVQFGILQLSMLARGKQFAIVDNQSNNLDIHIYIYIYMNIMCLFGFTAYMQEAPKGYLAWVLFGGPRNKSEPGAAENQSHGKPEGVIRIQ